MHNSTEKWCRFLFWSDRLTKWNKAPKHRNYCFLKPYWSDDDSSISMQGFFTQSSPNLSSNPQPLLACRKGQTHLPHITAQHLIDQLVQIDFLASNMGRWQPMKFKNCWYKSYASWVVLLQNPFPLESFCQHDSGQFPPRKSFLVY